MTQHFDFNRIGKRMPYTVPEGFFSEMTERVVARAVSEAQAKRKRRTRVVSLASAIVAMAASIALFLVVSTTSRPATTVDMADVESAFSKLSADEQSYLLAVYQEDIFMDNQ